MQRGSLNNPSADVDLSRDLVMISKRGFSAAC
jgi:hypothetical protein